MTRAERAIESAQAMRQAEYLMRQGVSHATTSSLLVQLTAARNVEGETFFTCKAGEFRGRARTLAGALLQIFDHAGLG